MKKFSPFLIAITGLVFQQCQNLEDAPIENRNTFMHFYEGGNSYVASAAEITSDGFIIVGTVLVAGEVDDSKMLIIKTDRFGQKIWETVLDGGTANSVTETANGYIVLGDSIQTNPNSEKIADLINNWSRMVILNPTTGDVTTDKSYAIVRDDPADTVDIHIDFHAKSITKDGQGNLITLGSFRIPGTTENSFISALNPTTLDTIWTKQYNYIDRNYTLANGVYYNNSGNILWASSLTITQGVLTRGYITVPVVKDSSTFVNSNYYGEVSDRSFVVNDLRPAAIGYCAIGTTSQTDGERSNLFFIRVDNNGNFKPGSARYFDGINSENNTALSDSTISVSDDTGDAITATKDGGYLLGGTLTTTPQRGNGGKDIWLIRLDAGGNVLWNKIIGGSTDETIASIRETSDGGFLICGSKSLGGQSSILLIKTDENGELRN